MDFTHNEKSPGKNLTGITVVVILHALIVYALISGLGRQIIDKIKDPVETKIIDEVKPPPPPPEAPPPPPPKMAAPPPPFIPPPEIAVQQQPPTQSTISAVSNVKPDNPVMPRPAPPVVAAAVAAEPRNVRVAAVINVNDCDKPEMPRQSIRNEEQGTVILRFLIGADGQVIKSEIEKSSGFKLLDKAARDALTACNKFKAGTVDGKPEQSWARVAYVWKIE